MRIKQQERKKEREKARAEVSTTTKNKAREYSPYTPLHTPTHEG